MLAQVPLTGACPGLVRGVPVGLPSGGGVGLELGFRVRVRARGRFRVRIRIRVRVRGYRLGYSQISPRRKLKYFITVLRSFRCV